MMLRRWMLICAAAALAGCAADFRQADRSREGGIGGTGTRLASGEGGIGGTGAPQRAGAVGTVTGFGSVHINGVRFILPDGLRVRSAHGTVDSSAIDLGETLEIVGTLQESGTVAAEAALIRHAVIGHVRRVSADGRSFDVLGAQVRLEPGAPVVDAAESAVALRAGDRVAVSALPRDGALIASRVERLSPHGASGAYGTVQNGRLHGIPVRMADGRLLPEGVPLLIEGVERHGVLFAHRAERGLIAALDGPLPQMSVEGYLQRQPASPAGFAIDGFSEPLDAGAKVSVLAGDRAVFIGSLEDGEFRVRHGLPLPDTAIARRETLEGVTNGYAPAGALPTR